MRRVKDLRQVGKIHMHQRWVGVMVVIIIILIINNNNNNNNNLDLEGEEEVMDLRWGLDLQEALIMVGLDLVPWVSEVKWETTE